jgi:hypothetical protein
MHAIRSRVIKNVYLEVPLEVTEMYLDSALNDLILEGFSPMPGVNGVQDAVTTAYIFEVDPSLAVKLCTLLKFLPVGKYPPGVKLVPRELGTLLGYPIRFVMEQPDEPE